MNREHQRTLRLAGLSCKALLLGACATVSYELPPPPDGALVEASREILAAPERTPKPVSIHLAEAQIKAAHNRLHPAAVALCRELGERLADSCDAWEVSVTESSQLNAYATGDRKVVVYSGLAAHVQNQDELAFVLGHEFAHHMLNHIYETQGNVALGQLVGLAAGSVVGAATGNSGAASDGASLGAWAARQRFSRAQEREADLIAAVLLHRAGYEPSLARGLLIHMAQLHGSPLRRSTFFDTHPVGPERLAHLDDVLKIVEKSGGALPAGQLQ